MLIDFDVVIETDLAFLPFGVSIGLGRQLLERSPLDLLKQRTPAGSQVSSHPSIKARDQVKDGSIEFGQREETTIAQLGSDPARHHLHPDLDFGFGESRQLQAVWGQRWGKRFALRTPSILSAGRWLN